MTSITAPTYDPTSTATALAQKYIQPMQDSLTTKTKDASATASALSSLQSAISAFQTSLASLTGLNQTMFAQSATLSDTSVGSATATAKATPATYSFFVEQVATANQVAYSGLADNGMASGSIDIMMGTSTTPAVHVDLSTADTDGVAGISVRELAAAINKASGGKLTATVITIPGDPSIPTPDTKQLMLTSATTGEASQITVDTSNMNAADPMKAALEAPGAYKELVPARDAIVWLGDQGTGTEVKQASNTITSIDGVSLKVTRAQATGTAPVLMTVGPDTDGTKKNVQSFITAYNTLKTAIDKLVDPGDPNNNVAAGAFAHDAGIRSLRDQLVNLLRPAGSLSLASYGITATRDGTLVLDDPAPRLMNQLAADPNGLDTLIGSTAVSSRSGIADKLDNLLDKWSDITNGQIKLRNDANAKVQKDLTNRQSALDDQYNSAYDRYLKQFTQLQELQSKMNSNLSMFDALFGDSSKS